MIRPMRATSANTLIARSTAWTYLGRHGWRGISGNQVSWCRFLRRKPRLTDKVTGGNRHNTAKRMPAKNQRTIHYVLNVNFSELHQARRRGLHHLAKETAVEVAIHR
jgi:hypothetical protein